MDVPAARSFRILAVTVLGVVVLAACVLLAATHGKDREGAWQACWPDVPGESVGEVSVYWTWWPPGWVCVYEDGEESRLGPF